VSARRIINTYDQLVAAGGGVAISYQPSDRMAVAGWRVFRVANGKIVATDPKAHFLDHGQKTFTCSRNDKAAQFTAAKAWVAATYGEHGPWKMNAMRDYVPERIQKQFPIRREPAKKAPAP